MTRKQHISLLLLLTAVSLGTAAAWLGSATFYAAHLYFSPRLPPVDRLRDVRMQQPLRVYSRDGKLMAEYGEQRRIPVEIEAVPQPLRQAFIAAEDDRFYEHPGVDYQGIIRAGINELVAGDRSQGGSTITMQVARNFFLTREKTYLRKANEIFLALKIERELSKDKILELYLNKIYLGKRAYGVGAAAQVYYGRTIDELELAQIAMIAGLPKAPSTYNPVANPGRAVARRNYVLGRMLDLGFIDQVAHDEAASAPISASTHEVPVEAEAPYVAEMVRADMVERYGEEAAYTSGMRAYTTIDGELQAAANRAVRNGLLDYTERHGYRGPIRRLELPESARRIEIEPPLEALESPEADETADDEPVSPEGRIERGGGNGEHPDDKPDKPARVDEAGTYRFPAPEADRAIRTIGRFANIRPGLVLETFTADRDETPDEDEQETASQHFARVYLGGGQFGQFSFESADWAAPYVSVNQTGREPESLNEVVSVGDFVWLRPEAELEVEKRQPGAGSAEAAFEAPGASEDLPRHWRLGQLPEVEGALVALAPDEGAVVSLVGGFDYFKSKFNRATQARRQPGSGFKPFVYSAALEHGFTAATIINDAPVVFDDPALEAKWKPENYSGKFYGPTRLREGLVHSRNLVSIRLLIALGIVNARDYAMRFGFPADALPRNLSLALGSGNVTPMEMAVGFAAFANGGFKVDPYYLDRVEDVDGDTLWVADYQVACLECFIKETDPEVLENDYLVDYPEMPGEAGPVAEEQATKGASAHGEAPSDTEPDSVQTDARPGETTGDAQDDPESPENEEAEVGDAPSPPPRRVVSQAPRITEPRVNYIMNSMLRDVIKRGTGRRALELGRSDLAGKTGTSNDEHDAWFNGFNMKYVASAWVGFDSQKSLGRREPGGRAALPIWKDYMRVALDGVPEKTPKQPEGIVSIRIDAQTGLLASGAGGETLFEIFRAEHVPTQKADAAGEGANGSGDDNGDSVTEDLF
jgi:penicillin-binding protein 1A